MYTHTHTYILKIPEFLTQWITCYILSDYDLDNNTFSAEV